MVSNAETEIQRDDKRETHPAETDVILTENVVSVVVESVLNDVKSRGVDYPIQNRHIICIPKVSNKITKQYIFGIFCALKIGYIEKLTEVPIKTDGMHKRIFVKVKWNQSELAKYIYNRFEKGENVKVVYSEPWYWICVSNMASSSSRTHHVHE